MTGAGGPVVPLGRTPPPEPEPVPSRPGRLHGIAISLMASAAGLGLILGIAYLTVTWSGTPRRIIVASMLLSILVFVTAVSISILTAARDTYIGRGSAAERVADGKRSAEDDGP